MSKKKRKAAKVAPPAKAAVAKPRADGGRVTPHGFTLDLSRYLSADFTVTFDRIARTTASMKPRGLADVLTEQIAVLTDGFDGETREELPTPPRDLTAYADAFASAARNCEHQDAIETLYGREWVCDTCRRVIGRDEMRRIRAKRGFWGLFG